MKSLLAAPFLAPLALVAIAAPALAAPPVIPIPAGKYHCLAGSSRMMLTLGDVVIAGKGFTFTDPQGHSSRGSYAMTATGYRWTGDLGAIKNAQIVDSGPDATRGDFWFKYRVGTSSLTTLACQRV